MNYGRDVIPITVEELAVGIRFTVTTYPDNVYEIVEVHDYKSVWEPMTVEYKRVMPNGLINREPSQKSTNFLNNSRVRLI